MATNKSMASRIQRAQASARRKKIAELESKPTVNSRKRKIAELEAAVKKAEGAKSKSTDKDDGKGKKPSGTAADKYNRKKVQPHPKGNKSESKLDKPTGDAAPVGYPGKGEMGNSLGKGSPKKDSKKSKQRALSDADKKRKDLTSATPGLKKTPKPKLSSTDKDWRRAKIAELKQALLTHADAPGAAAPGAAAPGAAAPGAAAAPGKASPQQRQPAFKLLNEFKGMLQKLQQANDALENAIMGSDLRPMLEALSHLAGDVMSMLPLGQQAKGLVNALGAKQASVVDGARLLTKMDDEFSRAKHLMRMAANRI